MRVLHVALHVEASNIQDTRLDVGFSFQEHERSCMGVLHGSEQNYD